MVSLRSSDARDLASMLDHVLGARAVLAELQEWRDRLVGLHRE
jgi:hypothetical protein